MRIIISEVIPADARAELNLDKEPCNAYAMEFVNGLNSLSMVFASKHGDHGKIIVVAEKFETFFKTLTAEVEIHDCVLDK
jgi:hypothetical protein